MGQGGIDLGRHEEKKEDIWLYPVTKAPTPPEKSKKQTWQHNKRYQKLGFHNDCGPTKDGQLSNSSHPTGVVKPLHERWTFPLTATAVKSKGHTFKNL